MILELFVILHVSFKIIWLFVFSESMSKKEKRIVAKKRKAAAFLNLVSQQEEETKFFDKVNLSMS